MKFQGLHLELMTGDELARALETAAARYVPRRSSVWGVTEAHLIEAAKRLRAFDALIAKLTVDESAHAETRR